MRLLAYFLVSYLVTWSVWFAASILAAPGNSGLFGGRGPVFLLGVFAPGLVALAFTAQAEGRAGVTRLLARIGVWRVPVRWYAIAIGYFVVIKLAAALAHRVITQEWPPFGDASVALMLMGIAVSTWGQAGEEVGWRGYALPRLAQYVGLGGASIVLGVAWAVWHLPLFILPDSGSTGQSFPAYLLQVMAMSVVSAFLYWKTDGSLFLVMVMHAAVNNTSGIVPAATGGAIAPLALGGSLVAWATVALSWVVGIPLLFRMRGADIRRMLTASPAASLKQVVGRSTSERYTTAIQERCMRTPLVLLVLGFAVVGGAVAGDLSSRRLQIRRAEDIRLLRVELDSTRGELAVSTSAADSTRLASSVAERTRLLASRLTHAGGSSVADNRGFLSGPSAVFATVGAALIALAISLIVRGARARK